MFLILQRLDYILLHNRFFLAITCCLPSAHPLASLSTDCTYKRASRSWASSAHQTTAQSTLQRLAPYSWSSGTCQESAVIIGISRPSIGSWTWSWTHPVVDSIHCTSQCLAGMPLSQCTPLDRGRTASMSTFLNSGYRATSLRLSEWELLCE